MKFVLSALLVLVLGILGYGFYLKNSGNFNGEIVIGVGVLIIAFLLMPLFIFYRYKDKDLSSFKLKNFTEDSKDSKEN